MVKLLLRVCVQHLFACVSNTDSCVPNTDSCVSNTISCVSDTNRRLGSQKVIASNALFDLVDRFMVKLHCEAPPENAKKVCTQSC